MTLSTLQNRFSFAGDGTSTVFPFNAKFLADTDLKVLEVDDTTYVETPKTIATHYTVSGGNNAAGSVTMLVAPAAGKTLIIYRDPSLTQDLDLIENDRLPVEELEKRLDKLTQITQRLAEKLAKAVALHEATDPADFDIRLPKDIIDMVNFGKVLRVNDTGDGIDYGPNLQDIEDAEANALAAAASAVAAAASEATAVAAAVQATESAADAAAFAEQVGEIEEVDTTGGNVPKTLPLASDGLQFVTYINKSFGSSNAVIVSPTGPNLIHGQASDSLGAGEVGKYWSNGVDAWYKID
jgi:hypothetical protein